MEIILKNTIFSFHDELCKQEVGCAMGTKPGPAYADVFMARRIYENILSLAEKYGTVQKHPLSIFKRFLDDIFSIFKGTSKDLHKLFEDKNKLHKSIKFTMNHSQ